MIWHTFLVTYKGEKMNIRCALSKGKNPVFYKMCFFISIIIIIIIVTKIELM